MVATRAVGDGGGGGWRGSRMKVREEDRWGEGCLRTFVMIRVSFSFYLPVITRRPDWMLL